MPRLSVYFAAPLFNESERRFNQWVAELIEPFGDVFLPQRDGSLLADMVGAGVAPCVAQARVYDQDRTAMRRADLLVAVLDGAHVDEGVAFEIGYAAAIGCVCVGLQTDVRRALPTGNNPMLTGGLRCIFHEPVALVTWIATHAAEHADMRRA